MIVTDTLLFTLHIGVNYYKYYSFVYQYYNIMEKHKQPFVSDETILTILSPYFLLLLVENIVTSMVLEIPLVLLLLVIPREA